MHGSPSHDGAAPIPDSKSKRVYPTCGATVTQLLICPKCGIVGCRGDGAGSCRFSADYLPQCLQCGVTAKPFP